MKVKKKYDKVVKAWEARNFDKALELLEKVRTDEKDFYYCEAAIYAGLENVLKEYRALKKLLPLLPRSSSKEKDFYEDCLYKLNGRCSDLGLIDECLNALRYIINNTKNDRRLYDAVSNACFNMSAKEDASAAEFQAIYKSYSERLKVKPFPKQFYNHEKIRVGFSSADFYNHVVMKWSWALLTKLDKNLFETYCYSNSKEEDAVTETLRSSITGWRKIRGMTDKAAAELIRDDEIDILFDLSGHTDGHRLGVFAYRPATVQISGIGFTSSTGLKTMDYFLTDEYCVGDSAPYFVENLIAMSNTHVCYMPFAELQLQIAEEPPCLKNGYVTFGSFNQYRKITDSMLVAWKRILDAVPNSRLLLKHKVYGIEGAKEFVGERLERLGIEPNRVELRGYSDKHPLDYNDMDIALDTFPYTGVTTTVEALLMNVPVISLYGDRHATRCGLSILSNAGLKELAVASYDEYVQRAVLLASDWEFLSIFRKNLRTMLMTSPIMDWNSYVREIEQAFIDVLNLERTRQ